MTDGVLTIRADAGRRTASGSPISRPTRWSGTTISSPSVAAAPGVEYRSLGQTLDGQEIDYFRLGDGPLQVWLYARQHPGETMAEWWMEGALERLLDDADPVAAPAAREGDLPHRPQHESGRLAARPSAHQRGRRQPQPRMARAEPRSAARKCSTSATRWTGPASISRWTSMATRRSPPISSPASRAFRAGSRSSRTCSTRSATALVAHLARFPDRQGL